MTRPETTETIGLIAGNGRFPVLFAENARRSGAKVVAVAHVGESEERLDDVADEVTWIRVGELGKIIRVFQAAGVRRAVMAGGIRKIRLFSGFRPDLRGAAFLARMRTFHDDALLRGLAVELEREGIEVVPSTTFLDSLLAEEGVLGRTGPKRNDWKDIALGFRVARGIGQWDVGQSVVVKNAMVLAVEAVEGTDQAIRRGAELGRGDVVVVKVAKPGQDLRFDVPAVGPDTIEVMKEAGGRVLAVEAGRTLLLDRETCLARADEAGIPVVGISEALLEERTNG